jgi:hypothetical protein
MTHRHRILVLVVLLCRLRLTLHQNFQMRRRRQNPRLIHFVDRRLDSYMPHPHLPLMILLKKKMSYYRLFRMLRKWEQIRQPHLHQQQRL